jgi:predicted aminopeptidase
VRGVAAFSTLGWFADPIVSSMLRGDADGLDGTIFHELTHQAFYLPGDTAFNESYATFVEREGLREWHASRGNALPKASDDARDTEFTRLVLDLRERLRALYASTRDASVLRREKQREFDAFRARYAVLRDGSWNGEPRYDAWLARPLNNARLVPFGLYDAWVPAFATLFEQAGRDWPRFHALVRQLGAMKPEERTHCLTALTPPSPR